MISLRDKVRLTNVKTWNQINVKSQVTPDPALKLYRESSSNIDIGLQMCYLVIQPLIAGIPITRIVGGVACGLITSNDAEDPDKQDIAQYRLLTDILVTTLCSLSRLVFL